MSEADQNLHIALHEKDARKHSCGHDVEVCGDPERTWYPQLSECFVEAETAAANAAYDKLHEDLPFHDGTRTHWAKERTPAFPYHYRDGVNIFVTETDLKLGGDFLARPALPAVMSEGDDQSNP